MCEHKVTDTYVSVHFSHLVNAQPTVARTLKNMKNIRFCEEKKFMVQTLAVQCSWKTHCCLHIQTARHHCYVFAIQTLTNVWHVE